MSRKRAPQRYGAHGNDCQLERRLTTCGILLRDDDVSQRELGVPVHETWSCPHSVGAVFEKWKHCTLRNALKMA